MTEKRFVDYFDKDHNYIIQDLQNEDEYQIGFVNCDEDVFLKLVNKIAEENEQLKTENTMLKEHQNINCQNCQYFVSDSVSSDCLKREDIGYKGTCIDGMDLHMLAKNCPYYQVRKMTENALIQKADMVFDDISGRNGRNFRLSLQLKTTYGGVNVSFNPMRLPQLLEQLELERFSELEGKYIQIPKTDFGETVKGIKSIMAKKDEEWFKTENDIYFGSEFFKGYGD